MAESNCLICLESLYDPEHNLGVTNPCGHPIHEACFVQWERTLLSRHEDYGRRAVTCPTCTRSGVTFIRTFLPLPAAAVEEENDMDAAKPGDTVEIRDLEGEKGKLLNGTKGTVVFKDGKKPSQVFQRCGEKPSPSQSPKIIHRAPLIYKTATG